MSIYEEIANRVERGDLFPLSPYGSNQRRHMFIFRSLYEQIENPPVEEEERFDDLKADLASFQIMRAIDCDYIRLLTPRGKGVWSIRSHRDEPQIRVFGQFAAKDLFVAICCRYRSELGGFTDPDWRHEIRRVQTIWNGLFFGAYSPIITSDPNNVFTGAIDEKYYK